jgi:hypothetical protein
MPGSEGGEGEREGTLEKAGGGGRNDPNIMCINKK